MRVHNNLITNHADTKSNPNPNPNPIPTTKHSTKYSHMSYVYR